MTFIKIMADMKNVADKAHAVLTVLSALMAEYRYEIDVWENEGGAL